MKIEDVLTVNFQWDRFGQSKRNGWNRYYIRYEVIIFFMEGKAMLECYDSLSRYIEALIKNKNEYK